MAGGVTLPAIFLFWGGYRHFPARQTCSLDPCDATGPDGKIPMHWPKASESAKHPAAVGAGLSIMSNSPQERLEHTIQRAFSYWPPKVIRVMSSMERIVGESSSRASGSISVQVNMPRWTDASRPM